MTRTTDKAEIADQRVAKGAALLDAHFGDTPWHDRIDREDLDLSNRLKCVLGQLFWDDPMCIEYGNPYSAGLRALGLWAVTPDGEDNEDRIVANGVFHGFDADLSDPLEPTYADPTAAWRRALATAADDTTDSAEEA